MRKTKQVLDNLEIETSRIPKPAAIEYTESDWVRMPRVGQTLFGITRSHLYQLWKQGHIRSVAIRQPGKKFGIRVVSKSSIIDYIAKLDREQNGNSAGGAQ